MIVTRRHLPRRTFLKGMGAAIALPDARRDDPGLRRGRRALRQRRRSASAFTYVPNGITMADWTPKARGRGFEFSRVLKPLEPFRKDTVVLSGLAHTQRQRARRRSRRPRARRRPPTSPACIRGRPPAPTSRTASPSIRSPRSTSAGQTRFASLELGCDDSRTVGNCDSGYSCAYTNSLAWRGPATPMPPETNPRLVFERLFGDIDTSLPPETRARRLLHRRSILDLVTERTVEADRPISDRPTAASSTNTCTSIREIEQRIEKAEQDMTGLTPGDRQADRHARSLYADYVNLMFDLQLVAFQTDSTRVVTMMMGREGSMRTYPEIGVPDPHHPLTHHRNNPEWIEKVTKVNTLHMELFAGLHREAEGDAGRRRHAARSLDDRLRQRPERRQPPHARRSAGR